MAYTHRFQIDLADCPTIEGEMSFNGGKDSPPKISVTTPLEMSLADYGEIGNFLKELVKLYKEAGVINTIRIEKKVV